MMTKDSQSGGPKVWPFLIGRNQTLDYRPILVPDFLQDNSALLQRTAKLDHHSSSMKSHRVVDDKLGSLVFCYRCVTAKSNNEDLLDASGRPVYRIEGFVCRGNQIDQEEIDEILSDEKFSNQAQLEIDKAFEDFWDQRKAARAILSEAVGPRHDDSVIEPDPPPPLPIYRIAAVIALVTLSLFWFIGEDDIELIAAESVILEAQDLDYIGNTLIDRSELDRNPHDPDSLWVLTLNTCAKTDCPYALAIFPAAKEDKQSLAPLEISGTAETIHGQFAASENLKNLVYKPEAAVLSNGNATTLADDFKDRNILYAVVHKFEHSESRQEGKWKLEFHDIRNQKVYNQNSATITTEKRDAVIQSLVSTSSKLASRIKVDMPDNQSDPGDTEKAVCESKISNLGN